jgi:RNA polymerase sigma factor (sigma-70 family)
MATVSADLKHITTFWQQILAAHEDNPDSAVEAQRQVLERYCGAVFRYLSGAVGDVHVAEDLAQDFAVRFLRGDFRNADPARGKFRGLLTTVLRNLVIDHQRRKRAAVILLEHELSANELAPPEQLDELFVEQWRRELLQQAWRELERADSEGRSCFYQVLRSRADYPEWSSDQLALHLSAELGEEVNAAWVRQTLRRARVRFAQLLRQEVRTSLEDADPDRVEEELADLKLARYCEPLDSKRRPR